MTIAHRLTAAILLSTAVCAIATSCASPAAAASISITSTTSTSSAVQPGRHQPPDQGQFTVTANQDTPLSPAGAAVSPAWSSTVARVNGYKVNLRTQPRIPSGIVGKYSTPMQLTVQCYAGQASGESWYRVKIAGWGAPTGFMAGRYIWNPTGRGNGRCPEV
jgi:hypothetical protein